MITDFDLTKRPQTMSLEEIPFPKTEKQKLIFWVDDEPNRSDNLDCKAHFEKQGIEVVQITSTKIMKVILRDFYGFLKLRDKKIVILSDMKR